ncbi:MULTISPECIES: septum site-determining protein MinC [unclassified Helicobacter]|uniref:septum site-determining protein MinC n=1 Tax=unclassified Helicobacter TaxID=2593540 RepID=UPI000CF0C260|nr:MULTISPECIES: septum site-determining protein MinC [unclassified Helicobacter]
MIKTRQRNIRVFEIDNTNLQECLEFLKKHSLLLRDYLIFFTQTPQEELKALLLELGLTYFVPNHSFASNNQEKQEIVKELKIISKPVRSGEDIEHNGDLIICDNVHHGARISATGCMMIFGNCEGRIECDGQYLILKNIIANHIIFNGQIFSQEMLERINTNPKNLKLVLQNGDFITIKELK